MSPEDPKQDNFAGYLRKLADQCDARAGFFDPDSVLWQISREPVLMLFGMRALLLQIAHPVVAQGVADHSSYRKNPFARGIRTFQAVHAIVFGSRDSAIKTALAVHRTHARVYGQFKDPLPQGFSRDYSARDPQALLWVAATLLDTSVFAYELCIKPLSDNDKEQYFQEGKRFGQLFGVPLSLYPATWQEFTQWMAHTIASDRIAVTPASRDIFQGLLFSTWLTRLLTPINRSIAAMTLPHKLKQQFGLKQTLWVKVTFKALLFLTIGIMRIIPRRFRAVPAARRGERRSKYP
jgi:uncharacterized protein (DUF2236 family)